MFKLTRCPAVPENVTRAACPEIVIVTDEPPGLIVPVMSVQSLRVKVALPVLVSEGLTNIV